jgi:ankyrin repeat protein
MRLLECSPDDGEFAVTANLPDNENLEYAILSHTWESEEVTFKDLEKGTGKNKAGFKKIRFCAEQAKCHGYQYFWVDTCCIDKSNQVELNEAIISMFRWYRKAARCYVYLSNVSVAGCGGKRKREQSEPPWEPAFRASRWFTRGWTLQELLAPASVEFFTREGQWLGDKKSLEQPIQEITGIATSALRGKDLSQFDVDERFEWANSRETTREEDWAYCLLGIFGVSMPVLYGEGKEHALRRLRKEIHDALNLDKRPTSDGAAFDSQAEGAGPTCHRDTRVDLLRRGAEIAIVDSSQRALRQIPRLTRSDYEYHKFANDIRAPGTCEWFLRLEKYVKWAEEDQSQLLWISADPGCGKSVLCSFLIDTLQRQAYLPGYPTTLCYFFFKDGNEGEQTGADLQCAILHQLLLSRPALTRHLPADTFKDDKFLIAQDFWRLWSILRAIIQDPQAGRTTFIIDALDECEANSRAWFVKSLAKLLVDTQDPRRNGPVFKFLITSRPDVSIEDGFCGHEMIRLKVEDNIDMTVADISLAVKDRIAKLQSRVGWPLDNLEKQLLDNADRTFLWVSLVLELLEKEADISGDVFEALVTTLPTGIDELYDKILNKLTPSQTDKTKLTKILHIIVAAHRPLTLAEANIAFRIERDDRNLRDLTDRLIRSNIQETLKRLCGPFIRIIQGKVHLVHLTAREFLTAQKSVSSAPQPPLPSWKHSLDPAISNLVLAGCCMSYLKLTEIQSLPPPDFKGIWNGNRKEMISRFTQPYDFLEYAAEYWPAHYRECEDLKKIDMLHDAVKLCDPHLLTCHCWFSLHWHMSAINCDVEWTPWIVASYLGHPSTFRFFQRQYPRLFDINEACSDGRTPLYFATVCGHVEMVRFLIDNGANIAQTIHYSQETVLHTAAVMGDTKLLEVMLETGIDPDIPAENGGYTALEQAAGGGHEEAVQLLLAYDADATDCEPLISAILSESERCVRALLPDAYINGFGLANWTPLHWAVSKDVASLKLARILLENGADPDAQHPCPSGRDCCLSATPLHITAEAGSVALSELLLVHGASVTSRNSHGQAPLEVAESCGHVELVRIMTRPA